MDWVHGSFSVTNTHTYSYIDMQVAKCIIKSYILIQLNMMSAKNGSDCKGYIFGAWLAITEGKTLVYNWCHACNVYKGPKHVYQMQAGHNVHQEYNSKSILNS